MRVRLFKPRFAALVKSGQKRQTIRPIPKRMPKAGEKESWRQWTGKPYRSPQIKLAKVELTSVAKITIFEDAIHIAGWAAPMDTVAWADGFQNFDELRDWFKAEHSLPFDGILIRSKTLI